MRSSRVIQDRIAKDTHQHHDDHERKGKKDNVRSDHCYYRTGESNEKRRKENEGHEEEWLHVDIRWVFLVLLVDGDDAG